MAQGMKFLAATAASDGDWRVVWAYLGVMDPLEEIQAQGSEEEEEEASVMPASLETGVKMRKNLARPRGWRVFQGGASAIGDWHGGCRPAATPNTWRAEKLAKKTGGQR